MLSDVLDFAFVRGLLAGVLMAAPVGAVGVMCIRRALTDGWARALVVGLGSAVADAVFGAVAGLGIGAISRFIVTFERELTLVGGMVVAVSGYFIYRAPVDADLSAPQTSVMVRDFGRAFVISIINPATLIGALGIFAVFAQLDSNVRPATASTLITGVFVGSMLWWVFLASLVRIMRERFVSGTLPRLNRIEGSVIGVFGCAAIAWAVWQLATGAAP